MNQKQKDELNHCLWLAVETLFIGISLISLLILTPILWARGKLRGRLG